MKQSNETSYPCPAEKAFPALSPWFLFIGNCNLDRVALIPKPQVSEAGAVTRLPTLEIGGTEVEIGPGAS